MEIWSIGNTNTITSNKYTFNCDPYERRFQEVVEELEKEGEKKEEDIYYLLT